LGHNRNPGIWMPRAAPPAPMIAIR